MTPAEANRRAREAHARDMAERRARPSGATEVPATLRNGAHGQPMPPTIAEPAPNDADSAASVLADARAVGLIGLKPRAADSPVVKDVRSAAEKREDEATAAMLEEMRRIGLPGLRKRASAEPAKSVPKKEDPDDAEAMLEEMRRIGLPGLRRR